MWYTIKIALYTDTKVHNLSSHSRESFPFGFLLPTMEVDIEAQLEAMARLEALKKEKEVLLVSSFTARSPHIHFAYISCSLLEHQIYLMACSNSAPSIKPIRSSSSLT